MYLLTYLLTYLLVNIRPYYVAGCNTRYDLQFARNTSTTRHPQAF